MAWNLLLTSDIGLLSLFTIFFVLGMGVFLYRFVTTRMESDRQSAATANRLSTP